MSAERRRAPAGHLTRAPASGSLRRVGAAGGSGPARATSERVGAWPGCTAVQHGGRHRVGGQRTGLDGSDGGPSARVTVIELYPPGGGLVRRPHRRFCAGVGRGPLPGAPRRGLHVSGVPDRDLRLGRAAFQAQAPAQESSARRMAELYAQGTNSRL